MDLWSEKLLVGGKPTVDWTSIGTLSANGTLGSGSYAAAANSYAPNTNVTAYQAFTGLPNFFNSNIIQNVLLTYYSEKPVYLTSLSYSGLYQYNINGFYPAASAKLEASIDNSNWVTLQDNLEYCNDPAGTSPKVYNIKTSKGYTYFRINATGNYTNYAWKIFNVVFTGKREK